MVKRGMYGRYLESLSRLDSYGFKISKLKNEIFQIIETELPSQSLIYSAFSKEVISEFSELVGVLRNSNSNLID